MNYEYYKRYCDNIENVENYEKAKSDNFVGWECHHRLETHNSDGERRLVDISHEELKALDMYYNRPAEELIFLTKKEHRSFNKGKPKSEEMKAKLSKAKKGKPKSEEHKKKLSEALKGNIPWNKGGHMPDKQRIKMDEVREAYKKSGRKDWNVFQKEYKNKATT